MNEPPAPPPAPPSIISRDLRIVGDIHSDGELQIDGVVEGDVRAGTLLVGDTADIRGDIIAENVHVHGRLSGHISARTVGLGETAHVTGDILHEDISIQMGAYLEGHCKRAPENARPAPPVRPARLAAAAENPAVLPAANAVTADMTAEMTAGMAGDMTAEVEHEPALDPTPARKRAAGS